MAAGDTGTFLTFWDELATKVHDLASDEFKVGLIEGTAGATCSAGVAAPHFGGTGTTDFSTYEITAVSSYAAGGLSLSATYTRSANSAQPVFDFEINPTWDRNTTGPQRTIKYGIIYNNTDANKRCVGWIEVHSSGYDLTSGSLTIEWEPTGFLRIRDCG